MKELEIGDAAPDFELTETDGKTVRLSDFRGKKVVLYFYPKDNTPGCTQEACDFRDAKPRFDKAGAVIIGISPDSEKSHQEFRSKYGLPFLLISDGQREAAEKYGVYKEKTMYGKKAMGIERSTFLIDEQGKITKILRKVKVDGHVEEVLTSIAP